MKAVIQKVNFAKLEADKKAFSEIGKGLLILLGIKDDDNEKDMQVLADKISGLRLFEDENGKMNLSVDDVSGEIMVVSNFTLYGDAKKGKRPSYIKAARPEKAISLYEGFIKALKTEKEVKTGVFGAEMNIKTELAGPVTLIISSEELL